MRKIFCIIGVVVLVGLTGCSDQSNSKPYSGDSFDQDASKINAPVSDFNK